MTTDRAQELFNEAKTDFELELINWMSRPERKAVAEVLPMLIISFCECPELEEHFNKMLRMNRRIIENDMEEVLNAPIA